MAQVAVAVVLVSGSALFGKPSPLGIEAGEVFYRDASLDLDGELLDWRFLDLVGDSRNELVVVVAVEGHERELRVHGFVDGALRKEPLHVVPLLDEILAWGCADVRTEKGLELLWLTPGGMWSYSLEHPGYRDNVLPLVRSELIYDLPDSDTIGYWDYVLPAEGGDLVLVPGREGVSLWGPTADFASNAPYGSRALYPRLGAEGLEPANPGATSDTAEGESQGEAPGENGAEVSNQTTTEVSVGGDGFYLDTTQSSLFLSDDLRSDAELFSVSFSYDAPALVDLDGDGALDLLRLTDEALLYHAGGEGGPGGEPTRSESLPKELRESEDKSISWDLVDLDSDGDLDLLARVEPDVDGLENAVNRLLVYRFDGSSLLHPKPDQVLRIEAGDLSVDVADVDGDGRLDLVLGKLLLPSMVGVVTGLEFELSTLVFLGDRRGFERKPSLREVRVFDEEGIADISFAHDLSLDCDGDGIADLVEQDLKGGIAVRRLRHSSSLLGGDSWGIEPAAWKEFQPSGEFSEVRVADFNNDNLGDIGCVTDSQLVLYITQRRGSR